MPFTGILNRAGFLKKQSNYLVCAINCASYKLHSEGNRSTELKLTVRNKSNKCDKYEHIRIELQSTTSIKSEHIGHKFTLNISQLTSQTFSGLAIIYIVYLLYLLSFDRGLTV